MNRNPDAARRQPSSLEQLSLVDDFEALDQQPDQKLSSPSDPRSPLPSGDDSSPQEVKAWPEPVQEAEEVQNPEGKLQKPEQAQEAEEKGEPQEGVNEEKKEEKPRVLNFSASQKQVIEARGKNLLVSASAGAGKTAVLVERLCQLVIQDRIPISAILAMTFTEDAAREMKVRLKARLLEMAGDPWIDQQISQLETASISTIHSFCLDVVQHYYYLAGLSYSMASHVDNGLADEQALEKACQQALAALDPKCGAELLLYLQAYSKTEKDLQEVLLKFLELARSKSDWKAWIESCARPDTLIEAMFYDWFAMRTQGLIDIFKQVRDEVENMQFSVLKKQQEYLVLFDGKLAKLEGCLEALQNKNYEVFASRFIEYVETSGKFTPTINKQSFKPIQEDSRKLEKEIAANLYTPSQFFQTAKALSRVQQTFARLAIDVQERFLMLKKEAGFIDFSDMEQYAWQILQNRQAADELREKYQVILIDEYQDTNDLQEAIINAIARQNNVFRVGDIKQSIYRFRQARPELMKGHLENAGSNDQVIAMQENYRSRAGLIDFNNVFFERLMNIEGLPSQFGSMDAALPGTESQKSSEQVPVRFVFTEYGGWQNPDKAEKTSEIKAKAIHRQHRYDLIAHDIEQKVASGKYFLRDIAILTRSSTPHDELKQALEAWGIRSIHHIRKGFYTNKSIQIVLSAMRIIQDPRNDIALMAALCSPLTGIEQDEVLPLLASREPGLSLYQTLHNSEQGYKMLQLVRDLKDLKNRPLPEIVTGIYGYHQFYQQYTTAQDKTNLDLLLQKAVQAQSLLDLDGFLESAALEENLNKTSEAIPFGREEDAVRISTIHASKGLQYKVVYLLCDQQQKDMEAGMPITFDADLGLAFDGLDWQAHAKVKSASTLAISQKRFLEETQEKMRLLYVACTRAEQELIFVDALKAEEIYDGPLDIHALLANKGFTSWFFHAFHTDPRGQVVFEKVTQLYERPAKSIFSKDHKVRLKTYSRPSVVISSQTASETKSSPGWKRVKKLGQAGSLQAREKGILIHEIVSSIPYPYQKEAIEAFVRWAKTTLDEQSIEQILALNDNARYEALMKAPHTFECPYCTREGEAYVHGFMDLVADLPGESVIVDFKTDAAFDAASLLDKYRSQLETYRNAMKQIRPGQKITAWIYSFALNEMIEV